MVIIGVAIVKNESDIIEVWVRYNLRFLDALRVLDNDSTDPTRAILDRLAQECPALRVSTYSSVGHVQETILTRGITGLVEKEDFDFVLPLDADEFIACDTRAKLERALDTIPVGHCGKVPWVTYVPTPGDDRSQENPLRRIVHRRVAEPNRFFKTVIPYATAALPGFHLMRGNHGAGTGKGMLPDVAIPDVALAHFPLRSVEQFASKVLIGEWALNLKLKRSSSEGWHWRRLAEKVVGRQAISEDDLQDAAASYAADGPAEIVRDPLPLPEDFTLKWPDLITVDFTDRVVKFAAAHFAQLDRTVLRTDYMAIGKTISGLVAYQLADHVIGRSIKLYGEWGAEEIRLLDAFLSSGDVVIDVGANIGSHTVAFAKAVGPSGAVHAFEPQRLSFQLLCANAALNGLTNVHAYQQGVSDAAGAAMVPLPDLRQGGNFGHFMLTDNRDGETVQVVTLDGLDAPNVKLIKIDVEGMEAKVLRGARRLIARAQPVVYVENNMPGKSAELIRLLQDLGYRCWWHLASYYNPKNFYANPENIFATVGRPEINMLCLPPKVDVSIQGLPVLGPEDTWQAALARSTTAGT